MNYKEDDFYAYALSKINKSSKEHTEAIKQCDRIKCVIKKYENEYDNLIKIKKEIKRIQFSRNGSTIHRGYYCPSPIYDIIVGNASRGRLTKNEQSTGFKYYYDDNNMVLAESYEDRQLYASEIILNKGEKELGLSYDNYGKLSLISECKTSDGRISEYTKCLYLYTSKEIIDYHNEKYYYNNGLLESTKWIELNLDIMLLNHREYRFNHEKNGYLSSYLMFEYEDDIVTYETPIDDPYVIKKRRKV